MQGAPVYVIEIAQVERIQRLVLDYARFNKDELAQGFLRIRKKLGILHTNQAIQALENMDYSLAAQIALTYYDKTYTYLLDKRSNVFAIQAENISMEEKAQRLIGMRKEQGRD
jgi:tRNA 2-selenouridine synthase